MQIMYSTCGAKGEDLTKQRANFTSPLSPLPSSPTSSTGASFVKVPINSLSSQNPPSDGPTGELCH
jgi:hypothetical protein